MQFSCIHGQHLFKCPCCQTQWDFRNSLTVWGQFKLSGCCDWAVGWADQIRWSSCSRICSAKVPCEFFHWDVLYSSRLCMTQLCLASRLYVLGALEHNPSNVLGSHKSGRMEERWSEDGEGKRKVGLWVDLPEEGVETAPCSGSISPNPGCSDLHQYFSRCRSA